MATIDDFVTFRQIVEEIIHGPGCNCSPYVQELETAFNAIAVKGGQVREYNDRNAVAISREQAAALFDESTVLRLKQCALEAVIEHKVKLDVKLANCRNALSRIIDRQIRTRKQMEKLDADLACAAQKKVKVDDESAD